MKKIILFIAASVCSVAMVNAQTDTTKTMTKTTTTQSTAYQTYPTKDMKKVSVSELPASLRTTLQAPEYKGWENSTVYYNATTGQYSYQAPAMNGTTSATTTKTQPQWYHFDKAGKRLPDTKPQ